MEEKMVGLRVNTGASGFFAMRATEAAMTVSMIASASSAGVPETSNIALKMDHRALYTIVRQKNSRYAGEIKGPGLKSAKSSSHILKIWNCSPA